MVRVVARPHCVEVVPLHHQRVADHGLQRDGLAPRLVVLVTVGARYRDRSAVHPQLSPGDLDLYRIMVRDGTVYTKHAGGNSRVETNVGPKPLSW